MCDGRYLGLLGEAGHDDHDVVGDVRTRLQRDRLTRDAAVRLGDGRVRERPEQQP